MLGLFRTFGQNALAAYIVHPMVAGAVKPYMPGDCRLWFVLAGFLLYFGICYMLIRYLEKNRSSSGFEGSTVPRRPASWVSEEPMMDSAMRWPLAFCTVDSARRSPGQQDRSGSRPQRRPR